MGLYGAQTRSKIFCNQTGSKQTILSVRHCLIIWPTKLYSLYMSISLCGIKSLRATLPDEIFYWGFCFLTVHFVTICVKSQQTHQLLIRFINYVWYLLHVSRLHCHPQGAFLVPSERFSIEEQSIEYCGWACCV
jgi:hypothetical protein